MTERNIKGVLFDLDGVLIDTEGTYTKFWEAVDDRFPTGVEDFAQVIKGSNLHNILHTYFPTEELRKQVNDLLNDFQRDMRYDYFPGTIELLEELKSKNIACCIVTSSDRNKMAALYTQHPDFANHFAAIVTGEMVNEPKPSPECFLLGAKKLGIDIKDCVVIEDSINGLKAGMASGARVIGLATTCSSEAIAPYCHLVLNDISNLSTKTILTI
ncbi:MAG: HAD family phosphatase [Muribaculaceae bacterium]|nr:HAD family phosphatase [Muribaculaceae bacterium]